MINKFHVFLRNLNKIEIVVSILVFMLAGASVAAYGKNISQQLGIIKPNLVTVTKMDVSKDAKIELSKPVVQPVVQAVDKIPELATLLTKNWRQISANSSSTCAIAHSDGVYCWGSNTTGQLGSDSQGKIAQSVDMTGVLKDKKFTSITSGMAHFCAIASEGDVYCWGGSNTGALGDGATISSGGWVQSGPVAVNNDGILKGKTIKSIAAGSFHTCAIASDNKAYCWGLNTMGQLGDGSFNSSSVPIAVDTSGELSGKTILSITAGESYTCAVASDYKVYCWGSNWYNQLGTSSTDNQKNTHPTAVDTKGVLDGKEILSISGGSNFICAIASDYKAYCWGSNDLGQLGDNSLDESVTPVAVDTTGVLKDKEIMSISAGNAHACVLDSEGKAYCWGDNGAGDKIYGQLGAKTSTTQSPTPIAVDTAGPLKDKTIISVVAGGFHTCAIASDDKAYCWGYNDHGQIGDGTTTNSVIPIEVLGL